MCVSVCVCLFVAEDTCRSSKNKELCTELQMVRHELTDLQRAYAKTVEQHTSDLHLLVTTVSKQQQELEKLIKVKSFLDW